MWKKVDNTNFINADDSRLVNNGLAYVFQEDRLYTSSGTEIDYKKYLSPVPTNMGLLLQKDRDLSSYFQKIDERQVGVSNSSLKHMLIDSHTNEDDKGKIKAHLPLEHVFGFCKTIEK